MMVFPKKGQTQNLLMGTFVQRQLVVNRAPLLTLWAAVVAEVLGFEHDEALSLGRVVAGLMLT